MFEQLVKRPAVWAWILLLALVAWHASPIDRNVLFPVVFANGKTGYVGSYGTVALSADWDGATAFDADGRAFVYRGNEGWYIDRHGQPFAKPSLIVDPGESSNKIEKRAGAASETKMVRQAEQKGQPAELMIVDDQEIGPNGTDNQILYRGNEVLSLTWGRLLFGDEGLAVVADERGAGFINRSGRVVIPLQWDDARSFSFGLAAVRKNDRWGYIDRSGHLTIPLSSWDEVRPFDVHGLAAVNRGSKWGCIDRRGWLVIPLEWNLAPTFDANGIAIAESATRWGAIDRNGTIVVPSRFDGIYSFDVKGMARVQRDGKWGFVNRIGNIAIPLVWDQVDAFDAGGLARVEKDGQSVHINLNGDVVLPLDWEELLVCTMNGIAQLEHDAKWGFVNRAGKVAGSEEWDCVRKFSNGKEEIKRGRVRSLDYTLVQRGDHVGIADSSGQIVVPPNWDSFRISTDGASQRRGIVARRHVNASLMPYTLCHLYDTSGNRIWSSDWKEQWLFTILVIAFAATVILSDLWYVLYRRGYEEL